MKKCLPWLCFLLFGGLVYAQQDSTKTIFLVKPPPEVPEAVAPDLQPQTRQFYNPNAVTAPGSVPAFVPQEQLQWQPIQFYQGYGVTAPQIQPEGNRSVLSGDSFDPISPPQTQGQMQNPGLRFDQSPLIGAPEYHNPFNPHYPPILSFANVGGVSGGARTDYSDVEISDFTGGLNMVDLPNKIADNQAINQVNFTWSPSGMLQRRPGFKFRKDKSVNFAGANRIFGLYNYYAPNGRNVVLAGATTVLYADTNQTGAYVAIKTGLQSNKYYDFETFQGRAIVVHEGDQPFLIGENFQFNQFGLVDSFTWEDITTSVDGCTLTFIGIDRDWIEDEWSGFLLCNNTSPLQHNLVTADEVPSVVFSNTNNTLSILYYATSYDLNYWHKGYLFGFFDYDTVQLGLRSEGATGSGCQYAIYNSGDVFDTSMAGKCIVAKYYMGDAGGQERIIINVPDAHHLDLQYPFNPQPANGDSFDLLKKTFFDVKLCRAYKNRLFLVDKDMNIIYFSGYNKYTGFGSNSYFAVKTGDGDKITALATFYDDQLGYKDDSKDCLVIFKNNSVWKLVFNSATDYYLVQVSGTVGCIASQSVANVDGKYLLFLHTTGVYAFDGRTVKPVSGLIDPIVKNIGSNIYNSDATAVYYDNHYYLSYRDTTDGYNDRCIALNTIFGGWTKIENMRTWLFANRRSLTDSTAVLFVDGRDQTKIYELDNRFSADTGVAIALTYKSKAFDFNNLQERKQFTYFNLDYYLASGSATANFYTDFGDTLRYTTTISSYGGYRHQKVPLDIDCLGYNLSWGITSSSNLKIGKASLKLKNMED